MIRILAVLLWASACAAMAQKPDEFRAAAIVAVTGAEGVQRAELPFEAHRVARRDLADIRVFNARGEALPFAFAAPPPAAPAQREALAVPLFPITPARGVSEGDVSLDVRAAKDGTLIALRTKPKVQQPTRPTAWVADASAITEPIGAVIVEWERKPGTEIARVSLEASDDLKTWQALASGSVVSLEQGGRTLLQPRLEFAARKAKYLRVTARAEGFALTGLRVEHTKAAPPLLLHAVTVGGRAGEKPGEFLYDLQAAIPVSRVQLVLAEPNVVAPAQLFARNDEKAEWYPAGAATFYRIVRGGEEVRSPALEIVPNAARHWLVRIDPKAGVPPAAPRLEAAWRPREIVFVARGDPPIQLVFGHPDAQRADLPVATLIPGYERGAELKLPLAQVLTVREFRGDAGFSWRRLVQGGEGRKLLLWTVLIGGVLLLAFMAWRIHRQVG